MTKGFITSMRDVGKPYYYYRLFGINDYATKITNSHSFFYPAVDIDTGKGKLVIAEMPSYLMGSLRISFVI